MRPIWAIFVGKGPLVGPRPYFAKFETDSYISPGLNVMKCNKCNEILLPKFKLKCELSEHSKLSRLHANKIQK